MQLVRANIPGSFDTLKPKVRHLLTDFIDYTALGIRRLRSPILEEMVDAVFSDLVSEFLVMPMGQVNLWAWVYFGRFTCLCGDYPKSRVYSLVELCRLLYPTASHAGAASSFPTSIKR